MLLVAFSRLMCCSRVCSANRSAGRPASSTELPPCDRAPGRLNSSRVAEEPAWGPPYPSGTNEPLGYPRPRRRPTAWGVRSHEREQVGGDGQRRAAFVEGATSWEWSRITAARARITEATRRTAVACTRRRIATNDLEPMGSARVRTTRWSAGAFVIDEEDRAVGTASRPAVPLTRGAVSWPRRGGRFVESDALARFHAVRSLTMVWKFKHASSRPWRFRIDRGCRRCTKPDSRAHCAE